MAIIKTWCLICCNSVCCILFLVFLGSMIAYFALRETSTDYEESAICPTVTTSSYEYIVADTEKVVFISEYTFVLQSAKIWKPCGQGTKSYDVIFESTDSANSGMVSKFETLEVSKDTGIMMSGVINDCDDNELYSIEFQSKNYYGYYASKKENTLVQMKTQITQGASSSSSDGSKSPSEDTASENSSEASEETNSSESGDSAETEGSSESESTSEESFSDSSESDTSLSSSSDGINSDDGSLYYLKSATVKFSDTIVNYFSVADNRMYASVKARDDDTILATFTQYTHSDPDYIITIGNSDDDDFDPEVIFTLFGVWAFSEEKSPINLCYWIQWITIFGTVFFGYCVVVIGCTTWQICKRRKLNMAKLKI